MRKSKGMGEAVCAGNSDEVSAHAHGHIRSCAGQCPRDERQVGERHQEVKKKSSTSSEITSKTAERRIPMS